MAPDSSRGAEADIDNDIFLAVRSWRASKTDDCSTWAVLAHR